MDFLNNVAQGSLEAVSFSKVAPGIYIVKEFIRVQTKYGAKIIAITEDFSVYLPSRFAQLANDDDLVRMNQECRTIFKMIYEGKDAAHSDRVLVRFEH